jgi:hypothetical protein
MNNCSINTKESSSVSDGKVAIIASTFLMFLVYTVAVVLAHVKGKAEVSIYKSHQDIKFYYNTLRYFYRIASILNS